MSCSRASRPPGGAPLAAAGSSTPGCASTRATATRPPPSCASAAPRPAPPRRPAAAALVPSRRPGSGRGASIASPSAPWGPSPPCSPASRYDPASVYVCASLALSFSVGECPFRGTAPWFSCARLRLKRGNMATFKSGGGGANLFSFLFLLPLLQISPHFLNFFFFFFFFFFFSRCLPLACAGDARPALTSSPFRL